MNSESNTYYKNSPYDIIKCKEIIKLSNTGYHPIKCAFVCL